MFIFFKIQYPFIIYSLCFVFTSSFSKAHLHPWGLDALPIDMTLLLIAKNNVYATASVAQ